MINETVILLTPFEDCTKHRLARHLPSYLGRLEHLIPYFYEPLQKIFSKVIVYDYPKRQIEIGVRAINEEVIELVEREHPKYVVWLFAHYEFQETTFERMRREGSIVIGWFFDDEHRFEEQTKWRVPFFNYCITNDIEAVPKYKELGARAIHSRPPWGIPLDRDWSKIEEKYGVSFVGGKTKADREEYINELNNRKIPIHGVGPGWEKFATLEEMWNIFETSKINLNFSRAFRGDRMQVKGRVFEVCLRGGFLLTEYAPGIEDYFEIDKEIVCFTNKEEMADKVIYYLNHDDERRAIAQAGWKRATSEHTPFHVLSKVFGEIEGDSLAKDKECNPTLQKIVLPRRRRKQYSSYYLEWAVAFSLENYKGLSKDALALSVSYDPFNFRVWCFYIIGFLPSFMRSALIKVHRALRSRFSFIP